jgi:hypothetical protein
VAGTACRHPTTDSGQAQLVDEAELDARPGASPTETALSVASAEDTFGIARETSANALGFGVARRRIRLPHGVGDV